MKVPIRMLGIATVIFWVFLAAFIALAAYSIKDLGLDVGETQVSTTAKGELLFSLPIFIDNKGYSSLNDLKITTVSSTKAVQKSQQHQQRYPRFHKERLQR